MSYWMFWLQCEVLHSLQCFTQSVSDLIKLDCLQLLFLFSLFFTEMISCFWRFSSLKTKTRINWIKSWEIWRFVFCLDSSEDYLTLLVLLGRPSSVWPHRTRRVQVLIWFCSSPVGWTCLFRWSWWSSSAPSLKTFNLWWNTWRSRWCLLFCLFCLL